MAIPGGVKRGAPRTSGPRKIKPLASGGPQGGGQMPRLKPPKPPKPPVVRVAPEVTRPVTPRQKQAINRGVEQARKRQFAQTVSRTTTRNQMVDRLQREAAAINEGHQRITLHDPETGISLSTQMKKGLFNIRKRKVIVKKGDLYLHTGSILGLGGSDLKLAGTQGRTYSAQVGVDAATKKLTAPALKALSYTAIPGNAIGKEVTKLTGSKAAGFVGSIALDPTTYLTFGRSKVATELGARAGREAYKEAIKSGATHEAASKLGDKAAAKVVAKAPQNTGLSVKVGRHQTSGRTTAYVARKTGLSKVGAKVRESRPAGLVADVRPMMRPPGISQEEHAGIRAASREARAQSSRGRVEAISKAKALKKALKPEDHSQVVNAIERGTVYNLPSHLRTPAREVELAFRKARRQEIRAGIKVGNRRQYFTHALDEQAVEAGGRKIRRSGGKRIIRPESSKGRQYQGTIEQIAAAGGPEFSTHVPSVVAGRLSRSAENVANAKFNRAMLDIGRRPRSGEDLALSTDDMLYRVQGSDLQEISKLADQKKALAGDTTNLRVLNKKALETARSSITPGASRSEIGKAYDKIQGGFKFIATAPNPGFHARNLYGDTFNAYLGQGAGRLAVNMGRSSRALRALGKQEEATRTLGAKADRSVKGITVRGKHGGKEFLTYDQLAKEAVNHGAIRSGFLSREIPELLRDTSKQASGREFGRHFKRLAQNREDLPRLATYVGARRRGLSPREAADWSLKHHFDYADLTPFERTTARRLLPFYTFSARNVPLQAGKIFTNPGKFANLEKVREELANQSGLPSDWQSRIPEYQQRGVPFPVTIGGKPFLASLSLPVSDLNQLTLPNVTTKDFGSALTEQGKKILSMMNPVIKTPVELYANYNFFFRGPIQNTTSPLVAAPSYVSRFPAEWKQKFGIVPDYVDKRTGKKGWGWPAKVDYVAKVIPGPPNIVQQLMSPLSNRRGQGQLGKASSYLTGIKPDPYDPSSAAITNAYAEINKLTERRAALSQRGIGSATSGKRETPEYRHVRDQIKTYTALVQKLKTQRGDAIVAGRKVQKTSPHSKFFTSTPDVGQRQDYSHFFK